MRDDGGVARGGHGVDGIGSDSATAIVSMRAPGGPGNVVSGSSDCRRERASDRAPAGERQRADSAERSDAACVAGERSRECGDSVRRRVRHRGDPTTRAHEAEHGGRPARYDVVGIGNALVDVIAHADDDFIELPRPRQGLDDAGRDRASRRAVPRARLGRGDERWVGGEHHVRRRQLRGAGGVHRQGERRRAR